MDTYQKIQTVFLRSPESNFKDLLEGQWTLPEFELLKDIEWVWTEKVDGTCTRVMWDGRTVRFGGKTDDAQISTFLLRTLQDTFTEEKMRTTFPDIKFNEFTPPSICLYGEGYGRKIQNGENYLPDRTDFILFDCKIDGWWLKRESLEDIATKFSIKSVPIIGTGTLLEAINFVKTGYKSTVAQNKDYNAEGLVMKPKVDLFNRKRERIITKIKTRDFRK